MKAHFLKTFAGNRGYQSVMVKPSHPMRTALYFGLRLLIPFMSTAQPVISPTLETVAEFGQHQPIGVGVSKEGRIFVTFPKNAQNYDYGLAEIVSPGRSAGVGQRRPYPNAEWNQWDSLKPQERFMNVQAVIADADNTLWVLDPANPANHPPLQAGDK